MRIVNNNLVNSSGDIVIKTEMQLVIEILLDRYYMVVDDIITLMKMSVNPDVDSINEVRSRIYEFFDKFHVTIYKVNDEEELEEMLSGPQKDIIEILKSTSDDELNFVYQLIVTDMKEKFGRFMKNDIRIDIDEDDHGNN